MPDTVVVCFTLNRQSIFGAAAVAQSIENQRRRPTGEPGIQIWPVPTRIELAEKERLESARDLAQTTFERYLGRMTREERPSYWGGVEVLYQPYFAYAEVLAVFAERRGHSSSMLGSMETLTRHITGGDVARHSPMPDDQRRRGLALFAKGMQPPRQEAAPADVYISYPRPQTELAQRIVAALKLSNIRVWWDRELTLGDDWVAVSEAALASTRVLIVLIGAPLGKGQMKEVEDAAARNLRVIPLLAPGLSFHDLPHSLARFNAMILDETRLDEAIEEVTDIVARVLTRQSPTNPSPVSPDDPQHGQWGGRETNNGRRLSAAVEPVTDDWFSVTLSVESSSEATPLEGTVTFHLHPTFPRDVVPVVVENGRAVLKLSAWGAFTVGAVADNGRTLLELDLSQDTRFPEVFRRR